MWVLSFTPVSLNQNFQRKDMGICTFNSLSSWFWWTAGSISAKAREDPRDQHRAACPPCPSSVVRIRALPCAHKPFGMWEMVRLFKRRDSLIGSLSFELTKYLPKGDFLQLIRLRDFNRQVNFSLLVEVEAQRQNNSVTGTRYLFFFAQQNHGL